MNHVKRVNKSNVYNSNPSVRFKATNFL